MATTTNSYAATRAQLETIAAEAGTYPVVALLANGYAYDPAHTTLDDVTGELSGSGYARVTLTGVDYTSTDDVGVFTADDPTFASLTGDYDTIVVAVDRGADSVSLLIAHIACSPTTVTADTVVVDFPAEGLVVLEASSSGATIAAADVTIDASGFSGNLTTSTTDAQALAEAVDALPTGGGGGGGQVGYELVSPAVADTVVPSTAAVTTVALPEPAGALTIDVSGIDPATTGPFVMELLGDHLPFSDYTFTFAGAVSQQAGTPWLAHTFSRTAVIRFSPSASGGGGWTYEAAPLDLDAAMYGGVDFDSAPGDGQVPAWSASGRRWLPASLPSGGVALGETSTTAYRGDRGKTAYDHSQTTSGNPHGTVPSDITGFDTAVRTSRLDQMATPTANVAMGSHKLTGLADATASGDAVHYGQAARILAGQDEGTTVTSSTATTLLNSTVSISGCVAGDSLRIRAGLRHLNNSGSSRAHTVTILLGSTTVATLVTSPMASSASSRVAMLTGEVRVEAAADQNGIWQHTLNNLAAAIDGAATTENLSTGVALDIKGAVGAGGSQEIQLMFLTVERVRT